MSQFRTKKLCGSRRRRLLASAVAGAKLPADFRQGDPHQLPVPDDHVDLVVCALALTHVPELAPVLAEFARVLRPGGHLVISDSRMDYPIVEALPDGGYGYMPHYNRITSEYLTAALPLGFQVRGCQELRTPRLDPRMRRPPNASSPSTHRTSGRYTAGARPLAGLRATAVHA